MRQCDHAEQKDSRFRGVLPKRECKGYFPDPRLLSVVVGVSTTQTEDERAAWRCGETEPIPHNEAANLPYHRKSTAKNFGFKDSDGNVHMLDKLGFYKIEYPDNCSQGNPYVPEDREWLDGNRKLRETMKVQSARYIAKLYGLPENWAFYRRSVMTRQNGRCAVCACKLKEHNAHVDYWPGVAGDSWGQQESIPDHFAALCLSCYGRQQRRRNRNMTGQSEPCAT